MHSMRLFQAAGIALAMVFAALVNTGCSSEPKAPEDSAKLELQARETYSRLEPKLPEKNKIVGYVVFPEISEGAAGIGGAYGKGVLFEDGKVMGYADVSKASIGLQLGGKTWKEVIVFREKEAMIKFKQSNFEFDATANVIAADEKAGVAAQTLTPTMIYLLDSNGLMFSASVAGQKFKYADKVAK